MTNKLNKAKAGMPTNQYYVVTEPYVINDEQVPKEYNLELRNATLPFGNKYYDIWCISESKEACLDCISKFPKETRSLLKIVQTDSEIQYTAFIDVLGFSEYICKEIDNDDKAEELKEELDRIINYISWEASLSKESSSTEKHELRYSWISDTFVINIKYLDKVSKSDINEIKTIMLYRLAIIVTSIHHYMATEFDLLVRGGISPYYSCITDNLILGKGVVDAANLEKKASSPRVIFNKEVINDEIYYFANLLHQENDLSFISKDSDGYYFINYVAMLMHIPPMIGDAYEPYINEIGKEMFAKEIKLEVFKKYLELASRGKTEEKSNVREKYIWLENYINRLKQQDKFMNHIYK